MCVLRVLLHTPTLFLLGNSKVGVEDQLPVAGVDLIFNNDLCARVPSELDAFSVFPSMHYYTCLSL